MLNSSLPDQLRQLPWLPVVAVALIGGFSLLVLYSAAGGDMQPWALNQGIRFAALFTMMLLISQVKLEFWLRYAYPFYALCLVALMAVELLGAIGGGSQRWLNLGIVNLQPSELMKIAIVLALSRYFHFLPRVQAQQLASLLFPALLIGFPAALVMLQPDLGTALTLIAGGLTIVFLSGARLWLFITGAATAAIGIPFAVEFLLHDYQRKRVLIFLDPEADPLGAGYHITQSKIAIGSGGVDGKGFLSGTQSHLQYLPEQHTDFIFATMAEEWGLWGSLFLLACYGTVLFWGSYVALSARTQFARLAAMGLVATLFFYIFINLSMVMGFAPVVGIPLPLMSYGGSAMLTATLLVGMLLSIDRQKEVRMLGQGPSSV